MTADKVATEALTQTDRRFKVNCRAGIEPTKGGYIERFNRHVRVEAVLVYCDSREANTVDRDTLTDLIIGPRQPVGAYAQAHVAAALLHRINGAFGLDYSGKHQPAILAVILVSLPIRRVSVISSVLRSASTDQVGVVNMPRVLEPIMWGDW